MYALTVYHRTRASVCDSLVSVSNQWASSTVAYWGYDRLSASLKLRVAYLLLSALATNVNYRL